MVQRLLARSSDITTLGNALKAAFFVQPRDTRLATCKLIAWASPEDIGEGTAILVAIEEPNPDLDLIGLFLSKPQTTPSLSGALMAALGVQPQKTRMAICELIVNTNMGGVVTVDHLEVVMQEVDPDLKLVCLLLRKSLSVATLSNALKIGLAIRPRNTRLELCQLVLGESASDVGVSEALATVVEDGDLDMELICLLLRNGASVDYSSGV